MPFVSYHCHSRWSDGIAGIADMIKAAAASGVAEFGMSDHLVRTPYTGTNAHEWSMPENGRTLENYLQELRGAAAAASLPVRVGVEADFFPETWESTMELLQSLDLDVVIGSVHYLDRFPVDCSAAYWQNLTQDEVNANWHLYWERIRQLAEAGGFDFVGHLDLPKKFNFLPTTDLSGSVSAALDAIAAAGVAIELNTAGWDKDCNDAYPSADLLRQARCRDIPVVLSADAHCPNDITRHYARGAGRLRKCGYEQMLTFSRRCPRTVPIP